jgi:ATP-dependent Clp protease ATP-binding subunit ClpB
MPGSHLHNILLSYYVTFFINKSNILKPPLARGQLRCMGATTNDEYRKYIEGDGALARRFQPIIVDEPSVENTISILQGLRSQYEIYHGVIISDCAIEAAVKLSGRYMPDRRRPDKAIDLIDEAASGLRIDRESTPAVVNDIDREICRIKQIISSNAHVDQSFQSQLDELSFRRQQVIEQRDDELTLVQRITTLKIRRDELRTAITKLSAEDDYTNEKLSELEESERITTNEINESYDKLLHDGNASDGRSDPCTYKTKCSVLMSHHVANAVSLATNIPIGKVVESERNSLLNMESALGERVIGQKTVISAIAKCIRLSRAGLRYHDRPLGVFLLLGPSGVGS